MRRLNARRPSSPSSSSPSPATTTHMDSSSKQQLRRPVSTGGSQLSLLSRMSSSSVSAPPYSNHRRGHRCVFLLAAAALASFFLYLSILSITSGSAKFSIYIDGGSTGTRIHVFAYRTGWGIVGSAPLLDLGLTASSKVSPGLSSFSGNLEAAERSLSELLKFAKGRVPRELWKETEVRLMATGGLRLLDGLVADRILESCRKALRSSGFRFHDDWATVISGSDEGVYAWITANYALGSLGGEPNKTTGVLELGGASAQITFSSSEPLPPEFSHVLNFGEVKYNLYSHSFLHLGQNVAYDRLHELLRSRNHKSSVESLQEAYYRDPCTPRGYLHNAKSLKLSTGIIEHNTQHQHAHSIGNFSECRSVTLMLLDKGKDKCSYHHCRLGSAYVPKLQGRFLATENFFHTSKFLGLGPTAFLSDLILAGEKFCNDEWLNLKKIYHSFDEEDLIRYCFSSAYIVALLHDSLGVAMDDERIVFANQVGDVPLDWALGAFILQKISNPDAEISNRMISIFGNESAALLALCLVSSVMIFTAWSVLKWKKPQLRTIYDLENGRYILARVNP